MKKDPPAVNLTEIIPSQPVEVSGLASSSAPIIFTDRIGVFGVSAANGLAHLSLEAFRHMPVGDQSVTDRVVVAHLRMPLTMLKVLKDVIGKMELMLAPTSESAKN